MKALVVIPTLSRADLLIRNKGFLESVRAPDEVLLIDNGKQKIDIAVPIERTARNLGVPGSWNLGLRRAFYERDFDVLALLQDDIIWSVEKLEAAKRLVEEARDVDLFLSYLQFSVQVHRRENLTSIGYYDELFSPAYCEDDDYALTMTEIGRVYERFHELDPLPGSVIEGTKKPVAWAIQQKKLIGKWGDRAREFGVNLVDKPWYKTNRGIQA
jgi:hypothetical protein